LQRGLSHENINEVIKQNTSTRRTLAVLLKLLLIFQYLFFLLHEEEEEEEEERSRDSSVCIVLSYGLDNRGSRVRFLAGAGNFSLHHRVQNGSGAHPASYPMGNSGSLPGGKATGA
jgi:hypothetical protein